MKHRSSGILLSVTAMLILILDTKTAVRGVSDGITVCTETLIPSLFPFLIISKLLAGNLSGSKIRPLRPVASICGIPKGFESILAIGSIGGYPIGAQIIGDAYQKKQLDYATASRILCFCNNAGPSFIFGMSVFLFDSPWIGWYIWVIQIISAFFVGIMLPGKRVQICQTDTNEGITLVKALESSVKNISLICGWVILFRVLITYITVWFGNSTNHILTSTLLGFLELSNGCINLNEIPSPAVRFTLINGLLSFGGVCVLMQTRSVAGKLNMKMYISGKILHCLISVSLALITQTVLLPTDHSTVYAIIGCFLILLQYLLINRKKIVASCRKVLYNQLTEFRNEA